MSGHRKSRTQPSSSRGKLAFSHASAALNGDGADPHGSTKGHAPDDRPLYAPVLVLNASYEPINICAARRALVLVLKGVAMTEEENGHFLHSQRIAMRLPSVIRLLEYRRIPHQSRALSRKNILLRDRNTCQYCGIVLAASELTLDHVVPRSRGGLSTWENLVACCHTCNRKKGNALLSEIELKLQREPRAFNLHTSRHIMRMIGRSDQKWRKYLFY
jgi:5-methylcytosine-specific restriction endonuclease McrA